MLPGYSQSVRSVALLTALAALRAGAEDRSVLHDLATPVGIERGIARIVCAQPEPGQFVRGRAFAVDIAAATGTGDVFVGPAHVLPADVHRIAEDCYIVTDRGSRVDIARFLLPAEASARAGADWVVLVTAGKLPDPVGRLRVDALPTAALERMSEQRAPLRLMLYSRSAEQDDCTFIPELVRARESPVRWITHTCRTWNGTSGAPIVIDVDGAPVVVAMNIGRRLEIARGASRRSKGIGFAIDDELTAALQQVTVQ